MLIIYISNYSSKKYFTKTTYLQYFIIHKHFLYTNECNKNWKMLQLEQQLLYSEFQRKVFSIMTRLNLDNVIDPNLRRQLKFLSMPGPAALPQEQLSRVRIF